MQCPKCDSPMEHKINPIADYEQCTHCKGLWLDANEDKQLKAVAAAIDSGDPAVGAQYNDKHFVYCPQCPGSQLAGSAEVSGIKMLRMVDPVQSHIWFEQCPTCYGRFFDAGELKDLSELTISDFFKRFGLKERK